MFFIVFFFNFTLADVFKNQPYPIIFLNSLLASAFSSVSTVSVTANACVLKPAK